MLITRRDLLNDNGLVRSANIEKDRARTAQYNPSRRLRHDRTTVAEDGSCVIPFPLSSDMEAARSNE